MTNVKILLAGLGILVCGVANAEGWSFGIGTGISALDASGDGGFNTKLLGPVDFDASLNPDEVSDYMESAFGFGGFAKKGDLTIKYSAGKLKLGGDVSAAQGGNTGVLDLGFTTIGASVLADYAFSKSGKNTFGVIGGIRYTYQEYEAKLKVNGVKVFDGSVDDSWVDFVVGMSHSYAISQTLSWSSQIDYGVGGSEGTTHFSTALNKVYGTSWLVSAFLDLKDIEYEKGDRGDDDWFYYEADETIVGVNFMYLF